MRLTSTYEKDRNLRELSYGARSVGRGHRSREGPHSYFCLFVRLYCCFRFSFSMHDHHELFHGNSIADLQELPTCCMNTCSIFNQNPNSSTIPDPPRYRLYSVYQAYSHRYMIVHQEVGQQRVQTNFHDLRCWLLARPPSLSTPPLSPSSPSPSSPSPPSSIISNPWTPASDVRLFPSFS